MQLRIGSPKGFTLIELLVILLIVGLLAAVALPNYYDLHDEAEIATALGLVGAMQSALTIHLADHYVNGTPWVESGQELMDQLMTGSSEIPEGMTYDPVLDRWYIDQYYPYAYAQFYPADDLEELPPRVEMVIIQPPP